MNDVDLYMAVLGIEPPWKVARVELEHGVGQATLPWAERKSQFTLLFERFAIEILLATDVSKAAGILNTSA